MSTEIMTLDDAQIVVKQGVVEFNGFVTLKGQAIQLSEQITQVEVTDENIQSSKKLLAAVNKRVKEIEDRRIAIKKELLEPYTEFESQVKEIVGIVKDADNIVRSQLKDLEEKERATKEDNIREIFNKRFAHYDFGNMFDYIDFIKPQHLNKSVSMKTVETEMVEWLERIDADIKVINSLPNAEDVLTEYHDTKDVTVALTIVNAREERKKMVQQAKPKVTPSIKQSFFITIEDEKDYKMVEMFMQQNNIQYKSEKVEN